MQPLSMLPRDTAISISAKILFITCPHLSVVNALYLERRLPVCLCVTRRVNLKHLPRPGAFPEIPLESEIFGFRTHNPSVNIVVVRDVEEMNG
jgi:hypothetical protein